SASHERSRAAQGLHVPHAVRADLVGHDVAGCVEVVFLQDGGGGLDVVQVAVVEGQRDATSEVIAPQAAIGLGHRNAAESESLDTPHLALEQVRRYVQAREGCAVRDYIDTVIAEYGYLRQVCSRWRATPDALIRHKLRQACLDLGHELRERRVVLL